MNPVKLAIAAGPLAALVLAATPASASTHSHVKRFGSCRAQGEYAICDASGSVNYPLALRVHVNSGPGQHVTVYWSDTCSKGYGAGGKSGHFSGTTPLRRGVPMSYRRPDNCILSADAQLSSGGKLHIWLTARKQG
jgi:hypothetical protein